MKLMPVALVFSVIAIPPMQIKCSPEQPKPSTKVFKMQEVDVKTKIKQALESGDITKARELLKMIEPSVEIIDIFTAELRKRQISRAENLATCALLQELQLKYHKAAGYWMEAAEALPDDMEERRAGFIAKHDKALNDQEALDTARTKNAHTDVDMQYVKVGLTEEGKQFADEIAITLKKLPTQFLMDIRSGKVSFPGQGRASFLHKLLDEIIKTRVTK